MPQNRLAFVPTQHHDVIVSILWRELLVMTALPVGLALAVSLLRRRGRGPR
jgi:hypothetical protein